MSGFDSVGTLLADIANLISEGRRILGLADKRHWGLDEHEQLRALDEALDEARKDFQELSPLVHGSSYYEHDRKHESIEELRALRARFHNHTLTLKDWARSGGPINPVWTRETHTLQKDLHRAQCRAAQRIFTSDQESSQRCLGAFLVRRIQRREPTRRNGVAADDGLWRRLLEELRTCAAIGGFERFGEQDIAFICDFCDGHIVWEDLEDVPMPRPAHPGATNSPSATATAAYPCWQAPGTTASGALEKQVVSAPVAIANHMAPLHGDWQARLLCPFCEEEAQLPQDEDDDEDVYRPANECDDLAALQEHLEWQHTAATLPATLPVSLPSSNSCQIM
ncbi:hypothetical protein HRG_000719 [Hirsutella rhossiliensis]|uniref:Uncharacterized protein n=1 Tax=Hirsutella rhossiliensis TaxID=111463 RepID=A0A9P8N7Q0_9HYPO|nr:uncharacterized protein HRG_00719 [Hirsutella rhossiliensis]KAH0968077.1 hypothetical protein HRG_00719 [Hirsutella rhossiliensis]